jgi:hypothetical protein
VSEQSDPIADAALREILSQPRTPGARSVAAAINAVDAAHDHPKTEPSPADGATSEPSIPERADANAAAQPRDTLVSGMIPFPEKIKRAFRGQPARPTDAITYDERGRKFRYWTDGSLRHA